MINFLSSVVSVWTWKYDRAPLLSQFVLQICNWQNNSLFLTCNKQTTVGKFEFETNAIYNLILLWFYTFQNKFTRDWNILRKGKHFALQIWDWWIKSSDAGIPLPSPISKTHRESRCAVICVLMNVICVLMDGIVIVSQISHLSVLVILWQHGFPSIPSKMFIFWLSTPSPPSSPHQFCCSQTNKPFPPQGLSCNPSEKLNPNSDYN